jgi:hypothetical protein
MSWKKIEPWQGRVHQGCLHAPGVQKIASLETVVAVGFGCAQITKDGAVIFDEMNAEDFHELSEFEAMAKADPDHDWRLILEAPLRSQVYQRHADDAWVLIESGMGFA